MSRVSLFTYLFYRRLSVEEILKCDLESIDGSMTIEQINNLMEKWFYADQKNTQVITIYIINSQPI